MYLLVLRDQGMIEHYVALEYDNEDSIAKGIQHMFYCEDSPEVQVRGLFNKNKTAYEVQCSENGGGWSTTGNYLRIEKLEVLKVTKLPNPPIPPVPPPNRIYKETFWGGLIETEESKKATENWRENSAVCNKI